LKYQLDKEATRSSGNFNKKFHKGGKIMNAIKRFLKDEEGVTAIEYALLALGIATFIFAAALALSGRISDKFSSILS
jgi:pilus assembly protein Flp/PilA